jgi:hypothetical protein
VVPLLLMFTPFLQHLRGEPRVSAARANRRARNQSHTPETSHESFAQVPHNFLRERYTNNAAIENCYLNEILGAIVLKMNFWDYLLFCFLHYNLRRSHLI